MPNSPNFAKMRHNVAIRIRPPCKDCEQRVVGCHSNCEKYKEYKQKQSDEYKMICDKYRGENLQEDYTIRTIQRLKRK